MATFFGFEAQPAYPMYPVDRGWRVARHVAKETFALTGNAAEWWFDHARDMVARAGTADNVAVTYWMYCVAGGCYLAGGAQYVSAMLFVALFLAVYVVVLSLWSLGAALLIGALALGTKLYSLYYRAYYRCPACYGEMPIPEFLCGCGAEHSRLWPSVYGVFHHTCSACGTDLPTLESRGRSAIYRRCPRPSCHHPLSNAIGPQTNVHISVVGGRSAGKSNYIVMATDELRRACHDAGTAQVTFPDPAHERDFDASLARLRGGRQLLPTLDKLPQAYNLSVQRPGRGVGAIAYFYDSAGEAYDTETDATQQTYFRYADGIILVIDPFSIPGYVAELAGGVEAVRTSLGPSTRDVMEVYERMVTVLESSAGAVRGKRYPHPLAVVVTKTDAFDLESRIGAPAAAVLLAREPRLGSEEAAIDRLTREFLKSYGLENFVRDVELQFEHVRFFSCSALGRMPDASDGSAFVPARVLEPLQYILRCRDVLPAGRPVLAAAGAA
jgi:hypothetical protein